MVFSILAVDVDVFFFLLPTFRKHRLNNLMFRARVSIMVVCVNGKRSRFSSVSIEEKSVIFILYVYGIVEVHIFFFFLHDSLGGGRSR